MNPDNLLAARSATFRLPAFVKRSSPFRVLVSVIALAMAVLVVYPLVRLLLGLFDGEGPMAAISETLAMPRLAVSLRNTGILILVAGTISVLIGSVLAWLNERTDARLGWAADILPIIPLMVPPLAMAIGWVVLLAPRAGILNVVFRAVFMPNSGPLDRAGFNIYSMVGLMGVVVIASVPLAYLAVAAALRNLDPALEEASRLCGRSPLATFRRVTLPAVRNAIATGGLLVVMRIIAMFSVPIIIGTQAGVDVLATLIFSVLWVDGAPRYDQAIVLSMIMLGLVQIGILIVATINRTGHHAKISGKGRSLTKYSLGPWRVPARIFMIGYIGSATILPIAALGFISLQGFWSPAVDWSSLSLENYAQLFGSESLLRTSFVNSIILGIATATTIMFFAAMTSYLLASSRGGVRGVVTGLSGIPASVPSIVIGVAFLVSLGVGGPRWSGTLLILFLAYLVLNLPQASRIADTSLSQVGVELWEGSLMAGAAHGRTFRRVLAPLMLPGLLAGWVIVFSDAFSEISASVFLSRPTSNPVAGAVIVDAFRNQGSFTQLAALTVVMTVAQALIVFVVLVVGRRRVAYLGT